MKNKKLVILSGLFLVFGCSAAGADGGPGDRIAGAVPTAGAGAPSGRSCTVLENLRALVAAGLPPRQGGDAPVVVNPNEAEEALS